MKKIICLIERLGSGGAQRQLVGLSTLLSQKGYNVELWSWVKDDFFKETLEKNNVKYRCFQSAQNKFKRIFILHKELCKAKPNLVISYLDTPSMIACLIKAFGGKYNLIVSDRNTTQNITWRTKLRFKLSKFANYIVPNSYSQENFIKKHFSELSDKVITINNFVDTDIFNVSDSITTNSNASLKRIIVVARVSKQKNPLFFIEGIKNIIESGENICVHWYGRAIDTELYNQCLEKIKSYNLEKFISFKPDTNEIFKIYPKYDIFCLPSLWEGYPNVVCEAMSCGLPVVCSAVSDTPQIVENGINGFIFEPKSIEKFTEALQKMLSLSTEERKLIGKRNRDKMLTNNSKESFVEKYINLIESL